MLKKIKLLLILATASMWTYGQNNNSPYSSFGFGELYSPGYIQYPELGGATTGLMLPSKLNFSNPASYRSIDSLRFVLEVGLTNKFTVLQDENNTAQNTNFNISHYAFGFPITKWWHTSFGLLPVSNRNYKIIKKDIFELDSTTKQTSYVGSGNLNKIYFGNAINILPNLSVGANVCYMFGQLYETSTVLFPDALFIRNTQIGYSKFVNGFSIETGLMYTKKLNNNKSLNIGITYSPEVNIDYEEDYLSGAIFGSNIENIKDNTVIDTSDYYTDSARSFTLPNNFGIGFSYYEPGKRLLTVDAKFSLWNSISENTLQNNITTYKNNLRIGAGYSYTPKWNHATKYYKRMTYRVSAFYNDGYIKVNNKPITEFAISAGLGFPIRRVGALINAGIEIGQKGLIKNNLVKENYIKLNFKINFTEIWFLEKKYD